MPYLRAFLGVFLVMIALATANQSLSLEDFCSDDTSQSENSSGQQNDQIADVRGMKSQNRFARQVPPQSGKSFLDVHFPSKNPALVGIFCDDAFLIPAHPFLSQAGLLPRGPSLI
jgi:hypothetical protein